MDILEALYSYLSKNESVKSSIGDKLYPILLPQDCTLPAIVYAPVVANYSSAHLGDTGFVKQTVQITCHANTYKEARKLSRLIKKLLQDYRGDMSGLFIEAVFIKTDFDLDGNSSLKFDVDEYMSSIEFEIHFNENKED